MSIVTDFAKGMHSQAAPMIGQDNVVIGNLTLACTLSEITEEKVYTETGIEIVRSTTAVCQTSLLPTTSIAGRAAVTMGESFRVKPYGRGGTFTTITLETVTKL